MLRKKYLDYQNKKSKRKGIPLTLISQRKVNKYRKSFNISLLYRLAALA